MLNRPTARRLSSESTKRGTAAPTAYATVMKNTVGPTRWAPWIVAIAPRTGPVHGTNTNPSVAPKTNPPAPVTGPFA